MAVPKSPVGCPMDSLLRLLMGPWTTYILWVLSNDGPTRFGATYREDIRTAANVDCYLHANLLELTTDADRRTVFLQHDARIADLFGQAAARQIFGRQHFRGGFAERFAGAQHALSSAISALRWIPR